MESLNLPTILDWLASPWVQGPIAFVLWVGLLLVGRRILLGAMSRLASHTSWHWDDILVQALSPALLLAILASGLVVLERVLPLSQEWDRALDVTLTAAIALALIVFVDRACRGALDRAAVTSPTLHGARGLVQGIVRGLIILIGLLIFLDSIGISITPLLASLGVGSLAVALALQDTLANLFAGLHMVVDKPIESGHLIQLESGEVGTVVKVGWRSTWIRTLPNNMVVVPNTRLAGSLIHNYSLDDPHVSVYVEVGVHYASDLGQVERVVLDVGSELMRRFDGAVPDFEPVVRFHTFGDSSINMTVVLRAREFRETYRVKSEFVKRLHARFREEGITIPFPIRTLDLPERHSAALRGVLAPGAEAGTDLGGAPAGGAEAGTDPGGAARPDRTGPRRNLPGYRPPPRKG